jgi:hypothetical protein
VGSVSETISRANRLLVNECLHAARSEDQETTGLIAMANLVDPYGSSLSDFLI